MCQERRSGASPARRPRPWRAVSAAVAGMAVLAAASGGCSAGSGQHSNGSRASRSAQGAGQSRGGAMRALAGVRSGVMFGGDVPLATAESKLGRKLAMSCACASACNIHGHDHAAAWSSRLPIDDLKSFWGVLGCACWAV